MRTSIQSALLAAIGFTACSSSHPLSPATNADAAADGALADGSAQIDVASEPDALPGIDGAPDASPDTAAPFCADRAAAEITACLDNLASTGGPPAHTAWSGRITSLRESVEGCLKPRVALDQHPHVVETTDASGQVRRFGLATAGLALPFAVGDEIAVEIDESGGGFSPLNLSVRVRKGGREVLLVALAGNAAVIPPLGLTWRKGEPICSRTETCGSWQRYKLAVAVPGAEVSLTPGQTADLGGYTIVLGDQAQETGTSSPCADWYVGHFSVAVVAK
jgi:hypothetical protein